MELSKSQKNAYLVIGVLFLLFIAVMVYVQLAARPTTTEIPLSGGVSVGGLQSAAAAQPLDTQILRDPRYEALDRSLLDQGRLPVKPPARRGKPNLF